MLRMQKEVLQKIFQSPKFLRDTSTRFSRVSGHAGTQENEWETSLFRPAAEKIRLGAKDLDGNRAFARSRRRFRSRFETSFAMIDGQSSEK